MNRATAVYGGTFDPVTLGHLDLLRRASALFGRVVVCVSAEGRATLFTGEERAALLREAAKDLGNVSVTLFRGLLVEEARRQGAGVLLRGVRGAKDLEAELPMAFANRALAPGLETVFLTPAPAFALVSSSLVREVVALGGDVSAWVPPVVAAAVARRRAAKPI
jgi:pantetheine-phosphate adenylyltransferase